MSPKERSIAYFKRGFTNKLKVALRYSLVVQQNAREANTVAAP